MLEVKNLRYSIDEKKIIEDITYRFENGKFYGIIGPNGAGKTTFLKYILKIVSIEKNVTFINSKDMYGMGNKEIAKEESYVPQLLEESPGLLVKDIVSSGRYIHKKKFEELKSDETKYIEKCLQDTNLESFTNRRFDTLSGGERQRVLICKALVQESRIMVLDEPLSNLDLHYKVEIMGLLKKLKEKKKLTIICVLHDINYASLYCDEVFFINNGKIVDNGVPQNVINRKNIKEIYGLDVEIIEKDGRRFVIPTTFAVQNKVLT